MSTVTFNIDSNGSVVAHHEGESDKALKVGTKVYDNDGVMTGWITAVDNPALGPEFGPTKYTIDWYFSPGFQDGPSFTTSGETADRFIVA